VDQSNIDAALKKFKQDGRTIATYTDFRKLLERKDVDVIIQGTPDHWHTLVNIAAANAKKDVYGEKPLTLTIDEGRHVIKAVRDNKIVFQTGTQQRSSQRFRLACEMVRNGRIGKLKQVDVFVPAGLTGGPFKPTTAPATLDWDFWQGQTPSVDYMPERCHRLFRWWFDYAGGPVTDWGAHHNDIARWGIGLKGPKAVEARVITPPVADGYNTPSEFEATVTWPNGVKHVVKTTKDDAWNGAVVNPEGQRNGIKFEGTDGWIWVNRDEISASDTELLRAPLPENAVRLEVSKNHMTNFFECVGSRKDPISSVEEGHRSALIGHLIVIALRTGRKLQWNPEKEIFTGSGAKIGNALLAREMRKPYDYGFVS
jgi:predicted dehydrogenase